MSPMKSAHLQLTLALLSIGAVSLTANVAQAANIARPAIIGTYTSAARVQTSDATNARLETFNSVGTGSLTSYTSTSLGGTYTSTGATSISNANQYGGASVPSIPTGGNNRFITVNGVNRQYTLTLNSPQAYFGMWWSAGDPGNKLDIYSGNTLLATFFTRDVKALIDSKATAVRDDFYGNPNAPYTSGDGTARNQRRNNSEPYAFLNFYGMSGTTFDRIVFTQTTNAGFESDNHTVSAVRQTVSGEQFNAQYQAAVPEPLTFLGVGAAIGFGTVFKRKLKRSSVS